MAIKAILFDCFGVLVMPGSDILRHDFPDKSSELHDLFMRSDYGYITRDELREVMAELTGLSRDQLEKRYHEKNARNEVVFGWVRQLKQAGVYKIGLLSNIRVGGLDDFLPETERQELFDGVVLSGELGITKPAREIYEIAAARLGVQPHECIMIDDLLQNTDGAERADMQAVLFDTLAQAQQDVQRIIEEQDAGTA